MLKNITFFLLLIVIIPAQASKPVQESHLFQFQIQQIKTERQGGQTVTAYVRYALRDKLNFADFPDYKPMRECVLSYFQPSEALPRDIYWEVIAAEIGKDLMKNYPLKGVSVQLQVFPNISGSIVEPGFHGPTYTLGQIQPLAVHPPIISDYPGQ